MKFLFQISFLPFLFLSISCTSHHRHATHFRSHSPYETESFKNYYESRIKDDFAVKDLASRHDCTQNSAWNNYFEGLVNDKLTLPVGLIGPDTCKFIWLYSLSENNVKSYINNCLKKKKLIFAKNGEIENPERLELEHVINFIKNLKKELAFGGQCSPEKTPTENQDTIKLVKCKGSLTMEGNKDHLITNGFLTTFVGENCENEQKTLLHFKVKGDNKENYGRFVWKFSAHRYKGEKEFVVLPGSCFVRTLREKGARANEVFYEGAKQEECNKMNSMEI